MDARGLIDAALRSDAVYGGLAEPPFVSRQTRPEAAAGPDGGWWAVIENACRAQAASLPGLFDLDDPNAALRPSVAALLSCVEVMGGAPAGYTLGEPDAPFADPDAIGWAYQFYQEEAKDATYAKLSSGGVPTGPANCARGPGTPGQIRRSGALVLAPIFVVSDPRSGKRGPASRLNGATTPPARV
jgi:hypothetical protein